MARLSITAPPTGTNPSPSYTSETWLKYIWAALTNSGATPAGSSAAPTAIGNGTKSVTTAGTAVVLASITASRSVVITAKSSNTGVIAVGGSSVVATLASRSGTPLAASESMSLDINDLNKIYIDATVNGEGVTYTYTS